ncbi:hypothetical protein B0T18DRAFT_390321 [Schizothecium vesticola]|uniref:Uncharacterized protein n=1 Tax=Schizothecium vesticola TaxID=314040 RepID=A0AA40EUG1_9PEZI|nr:hypothetical protein B0T18DRAFT_390321 [Schizothecium vesticola]
MANQYKQATADDETEIILEDETELAEAELHPQQVGAKAQRQEDGGEESQTGDVLGLDPFDVPTLFSRLPCLKVSEGLHHEEGMFEVGSQSEGGILKPALALGVCFVVVSVAGAFQGKTLKEMLGALFAEADVGNKVVHDHATVPELIENGFRVIHKSGHVKGRVDSASEVRLLKHSIRG